MLNYGRRSSHYSMAQPWWARWWVLLWYSYVSALQSLLWLTFSSVPAESRDYLGVDDSALDLLLDWGPIAFCITVFPATWLLGARPDGLAISIRLGAALCFFAALLRCVPLIVGGDARAAAGTAAHSWTLAAVHIGQFINAAVAPLIVASPAFLARVWFPLDKRTTATSIANVASALGRGIGFFLGPLLVGTASDLPRLLLVTAAIAALPVVATFIYLPALPEEPPSEAAAAEIAMLMSRGPSGSSLLYTPLLLSDEFGAALLTAPAAAAADVPRRLKNGGRRLGGGAAPSSLLVPPSPISGGDDDDGFDGDSPVGIPAPPVAATHAPAGGSVRAAAADIVRVLTSPGFAAAALAGGGQMAVYGAWSGVLTTLLAPRFTGSDAGAFGTVATFAGIFGGVLTGVLCDAPFLRSRLIEVTAVLCFVSGVAFALLAAALRPVSMEPFASSLGFAALLAVCGFGGAVRGGADPLYFELAAQQAGVGGGGAAGAVLTFFYHAVLVVCLSVPPAILEWSSVALAAVLIIAPLLLLPLRARRALPS